MADLVVINKADGGMRAAAARAAAQFRSTLRFHRQRRRGWTPAVLALSARSGEGVPALAAALDDFGRALAGSGELEQGRRAQRAAVAWTAAEETVLSALRQSPAVAWLAARLLPAVERGELAPRTVAELLAAHFAAYG
jgi:LAO/AO transport system kinase